MKTNCCAVSCVLNGIHIMPDLLSPDILNPTTTQMLIEISKDISYMFSMPRNL